MQAQQVPAFWRNLFSPSSRYKTEAASLARLYLNTAHDNQKNAALISEYILLEEQQLSNEAFQKWMMLSYWNVLLKEEQDMTKRHTYVPSFQRYRTAFERVWQIVDRRYPQQIVYSSEYLCSKPEVSREDVG